MDIKDLQRQILDAERIAEFGRIILDQHEQIQALAKENQVLKTEKEPLDVH